MCVASTFRIKGVNFRSPLFASFGCGHCEECRAVYKSSWSFRLMAELEPLVKRGWKMCFYTLTYSDEKLPLLPESVFKDPERDYWIDKERGISRGIPCFSKDNIEAFTKSMRDWFFRRGVTDVKYFIASEFGSHTQRPHHHGIYCVPGSVDTRALFDEVHRQWEKYGFVFPRDYMGGYDSHGYLHKPFVVDNPNAAMRYCAKYVTKDIYYNEFLNDSLLDLSRFHHDRIFKRCMQFHVQTKSLGLVYLDKLSTDESKLKALNNGVFFDGDDKPRNLPQYLKNKLLFTTYYKQIKDKRFVRRLPSSFMLENLEQIYNRKKKYSFDFIRRLSDADEWHKRELNQAAIDYGRYWLSKARDVLPLSVSLEDFYISCYGQDPRKLALPQHHSRWHEFWLLRFDDFEYLSDDWRTPLPDEVDRLELAGDCLSLAFGYWSSKLPQRSEEQRISDRLIDYFGHCA